jgi:hypothetical protein
MKPLCYLTIFEKPYFRLTNDVKLIVWSYRSVQVFEFSTLFTGTFGRLSVLHNIIFADGFGRLGVNGFIIWKLFVKMEYLPKLLAIVQKIEHLLQNQKSLYLHKGICYCTIFHSVCILVQWPKWPSLRSTTVPLYTLSVMAWPMTDVL